MNRDLSLWLTILTGPVIWFISLEAGFAVTPVACERQAGFVLEVIVAAALAITAASGLVAWREWRLLTARADEPAAGTRSRALAVGGMVLSALFFVAISAQGIATVLLDPCQ